MTVITLSRQFGSRGEEVAATVAQSLGLRLVDAETIDRAAQNAGVPHVALEELEHEGERGLVDQMLAALRTMPRVPTSAPLAEGQEDQVTRPEPELARLAIPFSGLFSPTVPPISSSYHRYIRMVGMVVRGLAHQGNVLIVGRGGQALLRNFPNTLHVLIVAPQPARVEVVMSRLQLDKRAAANRVRASDRARADYLRRYHDVDWLDPSLYHLVVNTGRLSVAKAAELIICAQQVEPQPTDEEARP